MSCAVLVIDVQCGLFEPLPRPFEADAVVQRINQVADKARTAAVPVIFVQHEQDDTVLEFATDGWKLQSGLEVGADDFFVRKTTPDSFHNTELQQILKDHDIASVAVCGYATEFCVDTTVRRAAALGFSVSLVGDAHTTHDKSHQPAAQIRNHHNRTLSNITSFGPEIRVVSSDDVVFD